MEPMEREGMRIPFLPAWMQQGSPLPLNSLADPYASLSLLPNLPVAVLNTRVEYS